MHIHCHICIITNLATSNNSQFVFSDILSETLKNQEPPAVEPKAIQKQQEALKEIKKDIEKVKPEVNNCRQSGQKLLQVVGEQDKPEISKNIHELDAVIYYQKNTGMIMCIKNKPNHWFSKF